MMSVIIILGAVIFIAVLAAGIIWAVREDEKDIKNKNI